MYSGSSTNTVSPHKVSLNGVIPTAAASKAVTPNVVAPDMAASKAVALKLIFNVVIPNVVSLMPVLQYHFYQST